MRNSHRGRMVVVAALASLAALMSMASPSAAATTNVTWDISGHILTHWDGVTRVINNPSGTTICVPAASGNPQVVTHLDTATGATHVNGASAYSGFDPADINIAGTNYQAQISGAAGTTTGSVNTATNTVSQTVNLSVAIKNCAGTTTLCTFNVSLNLTGHNYNGPDLPAHPVTGNTVTVSGSALNPITPAVGCNVAIRPTILNSTVSGTIHLTAH